MSKKYLMLGSIASFFAPLAAFAQEVGEASSPAWFPLLEVGGVIIAVLTVISMSQAAGASAGGKLSKVFMSFVYASILFAAALIWRAYGEITGGEGGFTSELVYEVVLYLGLIFMAVAGRMARKAFGGGVNG